MAAVIMAGTAWAGDAVKGPAISMKLVEPVGFPVENAALAARVAVNKPLLERFDKAGYGAVWQVDRLPQDATNLATWVKTCLKTFPTPPILAMDARLENGALSPSLEAWDRFLKLALPKARSVIVNYRGLDNFSCVTNEEAAIAACLQLARLVRQHDSKAFRWLMLDDDPTSAERMSRWIARLQSSVEGYYLYYNHGLAMLGDSRMAQAAGPVLSTGKPVIRGGFTYTAPRVRPGLGKDLREQYGERMKRYEAWITAGGYAGYSRLLGNAGTGGESPNLVYLPE